MSQAIPYSYKSSYLVIIVTDLLYIIVNYFANYFYRFFTFFAIHVSKKALISQKVSEIWVLNKS